jgi:hypothetical protein
MNTDDMTNPCLAGSFYRPNALCKAAALHTTSATGARRRKSPANRALLHPQRKLESLNSAGLTGRQNQFLQAGRRWGALRLQKRQLKLDLQNDPDGWITYALRNLPKARRLIGGKGVVISNSLRKLAQALHENKSTAEVSDH